jgi:glucose/arabinose dehydrogenase
MYLSSQYAFALVLLFLVFVSLETSQVYTGDSYGLLSSAGVQNNTNNISNNNHHIQYYLCTDYKPTIHCDPSLNELTSYAVRGLSSEIYIPSGNPAIVKGKFDNALKMQANRVESVEVNNSIKINPQNFSVTFWAKRLAKSEPVGVIISHSNYTNTAGWYFQMLSNGNISFAVTNSDGNVISTEYNDAVIPFDKFAYIAGTFDGSKVKLYKDGKLASEAIFKGEYVPDPNTPLRIGSAAGSMAETPWSGVVDDFALFNKTLTANEVKEIFLSNASYSDSIVAQGLVGYWDFDNNNTNLAGTSPMHNNSDNGILRTLIASMAFAPDGRLFFSEKNSGNIRVMKDDKVIEKPFATISDHHVDFEQGLLGLAIDPLFEKNHYVYLYYTTIDHNKNKIVNKLVRFTDVNNTAHDKVTLLDDIPAEAGFHSGGALAFGPDDKLYIGVGDATHSIFAQNPSVFLGKVLRINRDGTIPADNPYPNSPVYTIGHRNIFGISFDNNRGFGIIAENGDALYDEINLITKGGNYGFPTLQPPNIAPEKADPSLSILPLRSYWAPPAPTQTIYYEGNKFPELKNRFLFGAVDGNIYSLMFDPNVKKIIEEEKIFLKFYPYSPVTALATAPNGDIYFAGYGIYKLQQIDSSTKEEFVFPVQVDFSTQFNRINKIEVLQEQNKMLIDIQTSTGNKTETSSSSSSPFTLSIKIPKKLLDEIYSVANISNNTKSKNNFDKFLQPMNFTVDNRHLDFNIVKIKYYPSMTYHLEIIGADKSDEEEEEVDQVSIHYDDVIVGDRNTDDDYDGARITPEGSYISTKTKSLTLPSAPNEEDI